MTEIKFTVCIAIAIVYSGFVTLINAECKLDASQLLTTCNLQDSLEVTSLSKSTSVAKKDSCDVLYPKEDFAVAPTVVFKAAKANESYTLVMVDPDAPQHRQGTYYLHWIVANIKGSDFAVGNVEENDISTTISLYRRPGPPNGTGQHRYMFVVFLQGSPNLTLTVPRQRAQFNLAEWAGQGNSERDQLCGPVAGIQFKAQF